MLKSHPIIMIGLLLALILPATQLKTQECLPVFPRIFWNPEAKEITPSTLDHIFMFNTPGSCPYSFVLIFIKQQTFKFRCTQKQTQTYNDDQTPQYHDYVQTCSALIQKDTDIRQFTYQLFGSRYIDSASAQAAQRYEVQMPTNDLPLKIAVFSDWGPIVDRPYKPLNDTFDYLLRKRKEQKASGSGTDQWRISGFLMGGDYGYDLETDHCQRYVMFLNETSRISRFWPMMVTLGNHQVFRPKSLYLFEQGFVIGNISTSKGNFQRTQGYRFVNRSSFVFYDPYQQVYKWKRLMTNDNYQAMKNKVIQYMHKSQEHSSREYFILASHYPLICSQVDPHCRDAMANMPDFFEYLSTQFNGRGMVDLYIGSHMHQYERIWPFVNNQFVNQSSPYKRGRMANFVEAVAGVNYWEVEIDYYRQYFSSFATHNITGMGIMTISGSSVQQEIPLHLRYIHITTPNTYEVVDSFEITHQYPDVREETTHLHLLAS